MGTPAFSVPILKALLDAGPSYRVVGVFCQPDRPAGRGKKVTASPVRLEAETHSVPVYTPIKMRAPETEATLRDWAPQVAIVAAYGRILPPSLLAVPACGCINVHASLLPRHRGASPIAHALLAGDKTTGISIMKMDQGCDTGPVYATRELAVADDDTTASLTDKLSVLGADFLLASLARILSGELVAVPQDSCRATLAPLLTKEHGALDWREDAVVLERCVRAYNPWPGACGSKQVGRIQIHRAHVATGDVAPSGAPALPGTIVAAGVQGVVVACGRGALVLDEVTPEGRKRMAASAWCVGRGAAVGETFVLPKA